MATFPGMHVCVLSHFSCVRLSVTPRTVARQAPLSMGFPRQEYWSGLPFPPPGDLPDPARAQVSYTSCFGRRVLYHERHLRLGDGLGLPLAWPTLYPLWGVCHRGPSPSTDGTSSLPSATDRSQMVSRSLVALGAGDGGSGFPGLHSQSPWPPTHQMVSRP